MNTNELYHYGVKGMKWGVRRYQYADGTLTTAGKKRYSVNRNSHAASYIMNMKIKYVVNHTRTIITGKQYVDEYLRKGTKLSRIQSSKEFEDHAFYATYKKQDVDKYMGLFGKNLSDRAKRADPQSDPPKTYQLKLETTKKLRIPSDENASDITAKLLKEPEFRDNVVASIQDSKYKMRRVSQQILFKQAQNALNKDINILLPSEKIAIYKALNLSLTNHNQQEIAAQNRFYGELKKKGYNALLDYNDKQYSSYHAKKPVIVFDTDSVKLQSVTETNPKVVNKLYMKYNTERIAKESIASTLGAIDKLGRKTISECSAYVNLKVNKYLS